MFLQAVTAAAGALAVQTLVVYVVCARGFEEKRAIDSGLGGMNWCQVVSIFDECRGTL